MDQSRATRSYLANRGCHATMFARFHEIEAADLDQPLNFDALTARAEALDGSWTLTGYEGAATFGTRPTSACTAAGASEVTRSKAMANAARLGSTPRPPAGAPRSAAGGGRD